MDKESAALSLIYPDYKAGNFAPDSHFVIFFNRVNALINGDSVVLDYGAGRGKFLDTESGWKLNLCSIKNRGAKVIGVDIDPAVLSNPLNDENYLIDGARIPLEDNSVDLIMSWAVWEHVENPEECAKELCRVLRPGGWICSWTPNKWGYVGIGARVIPNRFHAKLLRYLGVDRRQDKDVFPVAYRMNTRRRIKGLFPNTDFIHHVAIRSGPPGYHGGNFLIAIVFKFIDSIAPPPFKSMMHIFLQKRPD